MYAQSKSDTLRTGVGIFSVLTFELPSVHTVGFAIL